MTRQGKFAALGWAALVVPVVFLALFFLWPVGRMLGLGLDAAAFAEVLGRLRTWRIVGQTLGMALAATVFSVLLGVPGAYVLYRLRIPGRRVLRAFATAPFALPTVVVGVAFRALFDHSGPLGFLGLDQSTAAVICAMVFFNYAVVVRTVGSMWVGLADVTDAARTLGAGPARAFFTVTLPQLGPAIAAGGGLVFLFCSTSFGIVQTLGRPGYGTLESEIFIQTTAYLDLSHAAVLSVLQLLIVVAALSASSILSARTERALGVVAQRPKRLTRASIPALVTTAATLVFLAAPLFALVAGSCARGGVESAQLPSPGPARCRLLSWHVGGGRSRPLHPNRSRRRGDRARRRRHPRLRPVTPAAGALGAHRATPARRRRAPALGISAVTVGFGFLITWGRLADVPTGVIVPLAQAVVALPLVVRSLVPILRAIDPRMREAAATLARARHACLPQSTCRSWPAAWASRSASRSRSRWVSSVRRRSSPAPTTRPCPFSFPNCSAVRAWIITAWRSRGQ